MSNKQMFMRLRREDKDLIDKALDKCGTIGLFKAINNIIPVDTKFIVKADRADFKNMMTFVYNANGKLYTSTMFRVALLAESEEI